MEIIKKRNNSPIGWRTSIQEEVTYLDLDHKINSNVYQRRKYLTIFGREFKVYDFAYVRDAIIEEVENKPVGYK